MKLKTILTLSLYLFFMGCSSMLLEDFRATTPEFIPQNYFNGSLKAYGMVKDSNGKIVRTFKGELFGSWDKNGVGTLDEHFIYNDGEKLHRTWTMHPNGEKTFIANAGDIVGDAYMQAVGNTIMIDYTMRVPYGNGTLDIDVRDWLHLQDDGIVLNHSKMKKFGIEVGELVITIIKE